MTKVLEKYDPSTYSQDKDKLESEKEMTIEYDYLMKDKRWTLVPLPPRNNLVWCKWIYNTKLIVNRYIEKK